MLNETTITALIAKGFSRWTKNGKDRLYINARDLGLTCTYYKTGNIHTAEINGEYVSNSEARRMQYAKTYIDIATGEVVSDNDTLQAAAEAEKHEQSVAKNADTIFNSPRGVMIGNKDGDVTFVEFFDYNCGYCKRAMSDMLDLMKSDPKLKVVLKEFPVLSQGSVEAAQVAVAVRMQDPTGKKYLEFHQKLLGGRGAADKARALAVAKDVGLDIAKLEKDMASPEVKATIEENFRLAESMGMNGTPSYVIGKQVVIGAVGVDGLKEKIGIARCGKATC